MVASLRIYWRAHLDRNSRELTEEDGCPVNLMEVQDPTKANTVGNLKIEDRVNTKLDHFEAKIIETIRKDMENIEEKLIERLRQNKFS